MVVQGFMLWELERAEAIEHGDISQAARSLSVTVRESANFINNVGLHSQWGQERMAVLAQQIHDLRILQSQVEPPAGN